MGCCLLSVTMSALGVRGIAAVALRCKAPFRLKLFTCDVNSLPVESCQLKMKPFILTAMLLCHTVYAQQRKECNCSKRQFIMEPTDCRTEYLRGGGKLYYQFNCDSAWLTLVPKAGKSKVIYVMKGTDYSEAGYLLYRLGFQLRKEGKTGLLFSEDCPANGPCNYVLVNKFTGKEIRRWELNIGDPVPTIK